jgi:hypothetical protein
MSEPGNRGEHTEREAIASIVTEFQAEARAQRERLRQQGIQMELGTRREREERAAMFERLVRHHDLTWDASDDPRARRRGAAQRQDINDLARTMPQAEVKRIWDAMLARTLVEDARSLYPPPEGRDARTRHLHGEERPSRDER